MTKQFKRKELAKRWNCNYATIANRQASGKLFGNIVNGEWVYTLDEVIRAETENPVSPKRQASGMKRNQKPSIISRIKKAIIELLK